MEINVCSRDEDRVGIFLISLSPPRETKASDWRQRRQCFMESHATLLLQCCRFSLLFLKVHLLCFNQIKQMTEKMTEIYIKKKRCKTPSAITRGVLRCRDEMSPGSLLQHYQATGSGIKVLTALRVKRLNK